MQLLVLGTFWRPKSDRFPPPLEILKQVKSLPFHIPAETWKRYPYRAEPPRKGIIGIIPPEVTTQTREAKASARAKNSLAYFFFYPRFKKTWENVRMGVDRPSPSRSKMGEKNAENFECPVTQSLMVFDSLKFCRSFLISRSFSCCKLNDIVCLGNSRRSPPLSSADGVW